MELLLCLLPLSHQKIVGDELEILPTDDAVEGLLFAVLVELVGAEDLHQVNFIGPLLPQKGFEVGVRADQSRQPLGFLWRECFGVCRHIFHFIT